MIVNCKACGTKLKIPDNSTTIIKCPQCKSTMNAGNEKENAAGKENTQNQMQHLIKKEVEKARQEIFNSLQHAHKEFSAADQPTDLRKISDMNCLLCMKNPDLQNQFTNVMQKLNYKVAVCKDIYDIGLAINNSYYDIIIVDEIIGDDKEAGSKILRILNFLPADKRRKTFVVVLSSIHMSRDSYTAFLSGANLIVNKKDLAQFAEILNKELDAHAKFYKTFNDAAEGYGR